jgi:GH43 family beta-xylosidase
MKPFVNPIVPLNSQYGVGTGDPYVIKHGGRYYHCYNFCDGVYVSVCDELADLEVAERHKVYSCNESGPDSAWYAPELHLIHGHWYIYSSPCYNDKGWHCMHVLRAKTDSPLGEFENLGMIDQLANGWNLDGTVLEHEGEHYLIWSSGYRLHIAKMETPTRLCDDGRVIVTSELPFETISGPVCEGPAILKRGNKIHLIYSVNDSRNDEYCLSRATFSGGDVLDPAAWVKCGYPIFERTEDIFGPGHCSFTEGDTPDEKYIVYHANLERGSGWMGRHVWAQKVEWDEDDNPILGAPHR